MFISYAQNFEDVMLWRALKHIPRGFYIDIGAQDPVLDSVSFAFYERGWRGVHVEPVPDFARKLREARPDEEVIEACVTSHSDRMTLFEIPGTGLSTGEPAIADRHAAAGYPVRKTRVDCIPLSTILDRFSDRDIHWMKIDVEGMESAVLESWAASQVRPWIVLLESVHPALPTPLGRPLWESELTARGYAFVYFDGLNRFYLHKDHAALRPAFDAPPNVFDGFTLPGLSTSAAPLEPRSHAGDWEDKERESARERDQLMAYLFRRVAQDEAASRAVKGGR